MRASRLLQILLMLQNRGRLTSRQLADALEVAPRTILRDVDAMTEAGLPIIVHQGNQGGIELGFEYRTRLTGLSEEEAQALAIILSRRVPELAALGLERAGRLARDKVWESFAAPVRARMAETRALFPPSERQDGPPDPRLPALAKAVQERRIVRLQAKSGAPRRVHPARLRLDEGAGALWDALSGAWIAQEDWGDINVSAHRFRE